MGREIPNPDMEETVEESTNNNMFEVVKAVIRGSNDDAWNTQAVTERMKNKRFGSFEEAFRYAKRSLPGEKGTITIWFESQTIHGFITQELAQLPTDAPNTDSEEGKECMK
jgi:hypothetical protein